MTYCPECNQPCDRYDAVCDDCGARLSGGDER